MLDPSIITRAANEGIPVAAIARIVKLPYTDVVDVLRAAQTRGDIGDMPKADWPPTAKMSDRLPSVPRSLNMEDVTLACRQTFNLTPLEGAFLVALLRHEWVDKTRLHHVIEQQRATRSQKPDRSDPTDPKMVDVIVCKLRAKLAAVRADLVFKTIWGTGYAFDPFVKQQICQLIGMPDANHQDHSQRTADGARAIHSGGA